MNDKLYAINFGYDSLPVGYFKTEDEAIEYCEIMNSVGVEDGEYQYEEFELLDLEDIKQNMKTYVKSSIVVKLSYGVFTWDIDKLERCIGDIDEEEFSSKMFGDKAYIKVKFRYNDEQDLTERISNFINAIQDTYNRTSSLQRAVYEIITLYNMK